jgi:HK97 family phage prohead protease
MATAKEGRLKNTLTLESSITPATQSTPGTYDVTCINLEKHIASHDLEFSANAFDEWLGNRDQGAIIPLFRSHNSEVQIGSVDNFRVDSGQLKARVYFSQNDDGRNVNTLIEEGHLATFSIGINSIVWGDEGNVIEQAQLHELSTTAIPADAQARILNQIEAFHYSMHCQGGACNASKELEVLARDALGLSGKNAKTAVSLLKQRDVDLRVQKRLSASLNLLTQQMER